MTKFKTFLSLCTLFTAISLHAMGGQKVWSSQLSEKFVLKIGTSRRSNDATYHVSNQIAKLMRNDGLFTDTTGEITLKDAVTATQKAWRKNDWDHTATQEEEIQKKDCISKGNQILSSLYREKIIPPFREADMAIGHAGVLPSVIKMFLAMKELNIHDDTTKLTVVLSPDQNETIKKTSLATYHQAATILEKFIDGALPEVTENTKPQTQEEVVQLVRQAFANDIPNLEISYVNKKDLSAYAKTISKETNVAVVASYPQLEAHMLTFAALNNDNSQFHVVAGYTAGKLDELEPLYDTKSPVERYKFDLNNTARILDRLQKNLDPQPTANNNNNQ